MEENPSDQSSDQKRKDNITKTAAKEATIRSTQAALNTIPYIGQFASNALELARIYQDPFKEGRRIIIGIIIGLIIFIIIFIIIITTLFNDNNESKPIGVGGCTPTISSSTPPSTTQSPQIPAEEDKRLTHEEALSQLRGAGIDARAAVANQGNCPGGNLSANNTNTASPHCTSFTGIWQSTVSYIINFKQKSGLKLVITGGTEHGHASGQYSHGNGHKIDLSLISSDPGLSNYIETHLKRSGSRPGNHGGPRYIDTSVGDGTFGSAKSSPTFVNELGLNHWDITVYGNGGTAPQPNQGCLTLNGEDIQEANADNCNNKYNLSKNWMLPKNFGDPKCDFDKQKLKDTITQLDPGKVNFWMKVVSCESGYNPNSWLDPNARVGSGLNTPDAGGAWGLFQDASSAIITPNSLYTNRRGGNRVGPQNITQQPGLGAGTWGHGGEYDRGDINWQIQAQYAVNLCKRKGDRGCIAYWACAHGGI